MGIVLRLIKVPAVGVPNQLKRMGIIEATYLSIPPP